MWGARLKAAKELLAIRSVEETIKLAKPKIDFHWAGQQQPPCVLGRIVSLLSHICFHPC